MNTRQLFVASIISASVVAAVASAAYAGEVDAGAASAPSRAETKALVLQARAAGALQPAAALAVSQPGHIGGGSGGVASTQSGDANLTYATAAQTNLDRNTVDMDRERASFADNSIKYEATLRFISGNVRTVLSAITGQ